MTSKTLLSYIRSFSGVACYSKGKFNCVASSLNIFLGSSKHRVFMLLTASDKNVFRTLYRWTLGGIRAALSGRKTHSSPFKENWNEELDVGELVILDEFLKFMTLGQVTAYTFPEGNELALGEHLMTRGSYIVLTDKPLPEEEMPYIASFIKEGISPHKLADIARALSESSKRSLFSIENSRIAAAYRLM